MEPTAPAEDEPSRAEAGRADVRSLGVLRDRVEAALREVERLRAENAALAKRLLEIEDVPEGPSFAFGDGEDPDALRARVQRFIDVVDRLLAAPWPSGDGAEGEARAPRASGGAEPNEAA